MVVGEMVVEEMGLAMVVVVVVVVLGWRVEGKREMRV